MIPCYRGIVQDPTELAPDKIHPTFVFRQNSKEPFKKWTTLAHFRTPRRAIFLEW